MSTLSRNLAMPQCGVQQARGQPTSTRCCSTSAGDGAQLVVDLSTGKRGTVVRLASSGTDETSGSSLPRDEILADHLRALSFKCDGELVVHDAFDLAIAEHGMMHRITARRRILHPHKKGHFRASSVARRRSLRRSTVCVV